MSNYSIGTIVKGCGAGLAAFAAAAVAAANGADLSHLDFGQWLLSIGSGLTAAGGVFHVPGEKATANDKAITTISDVTSALQQAEAAHDSLTQKAIDSIKQVQDAANVVEAVAAPVLGSLASRVIDVTRNL
jgi:hypothetical protein